MNALSLYFRYALRSFIRGRRRSLFGAFCVGVGVAAVVALGLVGGNFRDSVTGDARKMNRGDVAVSPPGMGFSLKEYAVFAGLKSRGRITGYTPRLQDNASLRSPHAGGESTVGSIVGVDSRVFPYYDSVTADDPAGVPLKRLLTRPGNAVISHDTLDTLHLHVGDRVVIDSQHGFTRTYTVAGVVPDSAINPFFGAGFWNDFALVDNRSIAPFFHAMNIGATSVYVTTRDAAQAALVKRELRHTLGDTATIKTVADVAREQRDSAAYFDKFFRIMGLVAVIIGGIGIVNTMLVAARRRLREIAVLKTLGMKGRQVVVAFTLESLILAVSGTALGILGGIGLSTVVNRVTENLAGNPIPWTLRLEPLVAGALVGIVATVLFAYMPILGASRAKPVAVLRGESLGIKVGALHRLVRALRSQPLVTMGRGLRGLPLGIIHLPGRPGVRAFFLVLFLAVFTGYLGVLYAGLAGGTQALLMGSLAGVVVLVGAAVITQLFVIVVWLISKLPSLGRLSLRMAFRSMGTQKRRLGSTMLALCIGMLAVGSIAILAQNMKEFAAAGAGKQLGFNAAVQSAQNPAAIRRMRQEVARLPGVTHPDFGAVANGAALVSIDGRDAQTTFKAITRSKKLDPNTVSTIAYEMQSLEGRNLRGGRYNWEMEAGRNLNARDAGTNRIVMVADLKQLGVKVGSRVVFRDGSRLVPFTVVGLAASNSFTLFSSNQTDVDYLRQVGLTAPGASHFAVFYLNMPDSLLRSNLSILRRHLHGDLVLDLSNFTAMINKTVDKFALFPEIIGALALFAGVIIIANTVALAMLERRKEIGVVKAVGAKRRTILQFLLIENAIVGFLGALAGVLLAMLATVLVEQSVLKIGTHFDWLTIAGLLLMGVLLAVGASALTALPASSEKPMTVLRYE